MALELDEMAMAGGTITIKGKLRQLNKLTIGDLGRVKTWIKERFPSPYKDAKEALALLDPGPPPSPPSSPKADMTKATGAERIVWARLQSDYESQLLRHHHEQANFERREKVILLAAAEAARAGSSIYGQFATLEMNSAEGVAYMAFLSLTVSNPDLAYEDILDHLNAQEIKAGDPAKVAELKGKLDRANELPEDLRTELDAQLNPPMANGQSIGPEPSPNSLNRSIASLTNSNVSP